MSAKILLARHATPDWSRTDIRYDIPPGPPLTAQGEEEAMALGEYLRTANVRAIFASPLERTLRTAEIAGAIAQIPVTVVDAIAEWQRGEDEAAVDARFAEFWAEVEEQSRTRGPVALITHGGPVAVMLRRLGMSSDDLAYYRRQFDRNNPLPPAGVWSAMAQDEGWQLELAFVPDSQLLKT